MRPYHDGNGYDARSHIQPASMRDVNHGAMNGSALDTRHNCTRFAGSGDCRRQPSAWTLPSRLFMVSAWAARRPDLSDPMSSGPTWNRRTTYGPNVPTARTPGPTSRTYRTSTTWAGFAPWRKPRAVQCDRPRRLLGGRRGRHAALRLMGDARRRLLGASAARDHERAGVGDPRGERGDEGPDRNSTAIFLTWDDREVSTTTGAAAGRRERLRDPRAGHHDQPRAKAGTADDQTLSFDPT
jgi:hypothetical protein